MFLLPKTITGKVILLVLTLLALNISVCTYLFTQSNYATAILSMESTLPILTSEVASKTRIQLDSIALVAQTLAADERISDTALTLKNRVDYVRKVKDVGNFLMIGITDADGNVYNTSEGTNPISDREYFKHTKSTGKSTTSELLESKTTGQKSIYTTAPIMKNGKFEGLIYIGTLYENVSSLINSLDFAQSGFAMIVDKDGKLLAHKDNALVEKGSNIKESSRDNARLSKIIDEMMAGKTGSGFYDEDGVEKYVTFTPVVGTNWSLGLSVDTHDFLTNYYAERKIYIYATAAIVFFSILLCIIVAKIMVTPLKKVTNDMITLVRDEARRDFPEFKNRDEMVLLSDAMRIREHVIQGYVSEIASVLKAVSDGDLTKNVTSEFGGSFAPVKHALNETTAELNSIINQINENSADLSRISEDFLKVFNILAQSTTEQAAAVEQLSVAIASISQQIEKNSNNSKTANELSESMMKTVVAGNENMTKMLSSMHDIESSSSEINKIVGVIEEIANQTNLLALNAAIEAARAGDAGRGFAVVADEVRKLAEKSSGATSQITDLITKSVSDTQTGAKMAESMAGSLGGIVGRVENVSTLVTDISKTSEHENISAREILKGVNQIAQITHNTSAAAEESSTTAAALASQADELKRMVERFRTK